MVVEDEFEKSVVKRALAASNQWMNDAKGEISWRFVQVFRGYFTGELLLLVGAFIFDEI